MVRAKAGNASECPPELFLIDAISGKWTVLVVHILAGGKMRHSQLQRTIGGISQKVLTQTLRNLERNGIVGRTVYPVVPPQVEYSLTRLGKTLVPVLSEVCEWARKHYREVQPVRAQFEVRERAAGQAVDTSNPIESGVAIGRKRYVGNRRRSASDL